MLTKYNYAERAEARRILPYCLQELEPNVWLVCNRGYHPLGMTSRRPTYEEIRKNYRSLLWFPKRRIMDSQLRSISHEGDIAGSRDNRTVWLYGDIDEAYFKRLRKMMKILGGAKRTDVNVNFGRQ